MSYKEACPEKKKEKKLTLTTRIRTLEESNYKLAGKGKYSLVYTNGNHCIKLVSEQDKAQIDYLTDPNFKTLCGQYHPNYINSNTVRDGYFEFYGRAFDKPPARYKGVTWKHYVRCVRDYAYKGKRSYLIGKELATAIDYIVKFAREKDYMVDIHSLNLMFDNGQLVLNDPIAPKTNQ